MLNAAYSLEMATQLSGGDAVKKHVLVYKASFEVLPVE